MGDGTRRFGDRPWHRGEPVATRAALRGGSGRPNIPRIPRPMSSRIMQGVGTRINVMNVAPLHRSPRSCRLPGLAGSRRGAAQESGAPRCCRCAAPAPRTRPGPRPRSTTPCRRPPLCARRPARQGAGAHSGETYHRMRTWRCSRAQRPFGEREHERLVEAAGVPDVLEAGVVLEPGAAQSVGELPREALGDLAVDEESEAFPRRPQTSRAGQRGPRPFRRIVSPPLRLAVGHGNRPSLPPGSRLCLHGLALQFMQCCSILPSPLLPSIAGAAQ